MGTTHLVSRTLAQPSREPQRLFFWLLPQSRGILTPTPYGHGYGAGIYYGKREAEAYTIGQVAYGGVRGVVTGVDYGYGRVAGYEAIGNRGIGFAGHFYG